MIYTVKKGDTLYRIAKNNGLTLKRLLELNPDIKNPNLIYPGQQIFLRGVDGVKGEGQGVVEFYLNKGWIISSDYGIRRDPFTGSNAFHRGIDFAGKPLGEEIFTPVEGKVIYSSYYNGWGNLIGIEDQGGYIHLFAHLQQRFKKVGERVNKEDVIGLNGSTGKSTGPHLHYQINTPRGGMIGINAHTDPKMFLI
ncbi:LysM peptidoglycan-binding domain-containing M23 family metallopeptidase [Anaerobranca gottschalkii]|uniref:LysM domain-containing protein n=1 Tax=Anaerobranca gottschalkii DSM 13577 TaxID=1120990 RepID=A0A1H9YI05_9FIRM|nr:LysM peptidoglycan-binding domain-containing M23 family metallopeptidase [Anaerobranca gottschalkii]SES68143.1 LysM domain-containing protein [Anaerobranca gottschalkii DSM 13577]